MIHLRCRRVDFELKDLQQFVGNHPPDGGIIGGDIYIWQMESELFLMATNTSPWMSITLP